MGSNCCLFCRLLLGAVLLVTSSLTASAQTDPARWLDFEFSRDSPVLVVSFSLGPTSARVRGMSMAIEIHASLLLRNTGTKPLAGLSLSVGAQDLTPPGHGSVTLPSLNVRPGDVFPVKIDMELLRPFNSVPKASGAMVQVALDCALFDDLTFYGPDRLKQRRSLTVYELQARRDRRYLARLLQSNRIPELREELNFGLQDLGPERFGLELLPASPQQPAHPESMTIEAVSFASSPVSPMRGTTTVAGNEVFSPSIEVKNNGQRSVKSLDMGWIVRDGHGRDYLAGSIGGPIQIGPVQQQTVRNVGTVRFSRSEGGPLAIQGVLAFINDIEFGDGQFWIPTRDDINGATSDPFLRRALSNSPEQQRLSNVYRRRGISGLAEELRR